MENLDVGIVESLEPEFQDLVNNFLDDACAQAKDRFCSQACDIYAGIADFVERAFNAFSDAVQPVVNALVVCRS